MRGPGCPRGSITEGPQLNSFGQLNNPQLLASKDVHFAVFVIINITVSRDS